MNSILVAAIAFVCLFGGAIVGTFIRRALPEHHLSDASRTLLQMALGIIGTMSGIVLGLLLASATASYNAQRSELLDACSKILTLDHLLAHYGPEANASRRTLRLAVEAALVRMWPSERSNSTRIDTSVPGERLFDYVQSLPVKSDEQRALKSEALSLTIDLGQVRWLMYEQTAESLSSPLLAVLIFWFTITFIGFGLFSPQNATVMVALALGALAVSGAILVMLEMYTPFQGIVQLSSAPLRDALAHLGH